MRKRVLTPELVIETARTRIIGVACSRSTEVAVHDVFIEVLGIPNIGSCAVARIAVYVSAFHDVGIDAFLPSGRVFRLIVGEPQMPTPKIFILATRLFSNADHHIAKSSVDRFEIEERFAPTRIIGVASGNGTVFRAEIDKPRGLILPNNLSDPFGSG